MSIFICLFYLTDLQNTTQNRPDDPSYQVRLTYSYKYHEIELHPALHIPNMLYKTKLIKYQLECSNHQSTVLSWDIDRDLLCLAKTQLDGMQLLTLCVIRFLNVALICILYYETYMGSTTRIELVTLFSPRQICLTLVYGYGPKSS